MENFSTIKSLQQCFRHTTTIFLEDTEESSSLG